MSGGIGNSYPMYVTASIAPTQDAHAARSPEATFSAVELASFASGFEQVRARLPGLFQSFWHRWSYRPEVPALLVHAEDGSIALCLVRSDPRLVRIPGTENCRLLQHWPRRSPLHEVLRAAGLT